MQNKQKIKENLNLKKKALSLLSKAIAKIMLKFRLPRNEFLMELDEKLILEAKRIDPKASNVAIAIRTGIDRRFISKHLKGEMPKTKPNKLTVILEEINWVTSKFYHSNKLPLTGPFRTFQSICESIAAGSLTYQAILAELVDNGNVVVKGNDVELIKLKSANKNEVNYSQITATQINRLVNTVIFNAEIADKQEKLVQRTIYSTQIHPKNFTDLHKQLIKKTDFYRDEIAALMQHYEEDVNIGTYPEYGYSFLEYNIEKKS